MKSKIKYKEPGNSIWGQRINKRLKEKKITQKTLASNVTVSESTLSGWIGNKDNENSTIPSVDKLKPIADELNVTVSYLLGESECKDIKDESIHRKTGLSDEAIKVLKKLKRQSEKAKKEGTRREQKEKLEVINFLIENADSNNLLEDIHSYLFGQFYFQNPINPNDNVVRYTRSKQPDKNELGTLLVGKELGKLYLTDIQEELVRIKDNKSINEMEDEKEKYEEWQKTEGKKIQEEQWNEEIILEAKEREKNK